RRAPRPGHRARAVVDLESAAAVPALRHRTVRPRIRRGDGRGPGPAAPRRRHRRGPAGPRDPRRRDSGAHRADPPVRPESGDPSVTAPHRVGVVGAGTMGAGLAQCLAEAGLTVTVVEPDTTATARARRDIRGSVRAMALLRPGSDVTRLAEAVAGIRWTAEAAELHDADLVIESVTERIDLK